MKGRRKKGRGQGFDWGKGNGHVYSRGNLLILNDSAEQGCSWSRLLYYNMSIELNSDLGHRARP